MNINQMSLIYVTEQDRILLRINTKADEEMRLWFTRRLTLQLTPAITALAADQTAQIAMATTPIASTDEHSKKMLADFKKQETLQNANFKTPFKEKAATLPFGDRPLLVTDMRIVALSNGALEINVQGMNETQGSSQGFKMVLDISLLHAFIHLLEKAVVKSEWLGMAGSATEPLEGDAAVAAGDKPKYLN